MMKMNHTNKERKKFKLNKPKKKAEPIKENAYSNLSERCRQRNSHDLMNGIVAIENTFQEVVIRSICKDCFAIVEAKGKWE